MKPWILGLTALFAACSPDTQEPAAPPPTATWTLTDAAVPATLVVVMEGIKTVDNSLLNAARSFGAAFSPHCARSLRPCAGWPGFARARRTLARRIRLLRRPRMSKHQQQAMKMSVD